MLELGPKAAGVIGEAVGDHRDHGDRLGAARRQRIDLAQVLGLGIGAGRGRQLFLHQQRVDAGIGQQDVDDAEVALAAAQRREAAVERIAERGADAEHFAQPRRGLRLQGREGEAVAGRGFEHQALEAARERQRAEPRATRRRRMGEVVHGLDHLVERVDPHHPQRLGHRIEAGKRARERAGVGERGLAALLRAADLDRHDRLAGIARIFAGALELIRLPDRLDEAADHLDVGIVHQIADVVRRAEPDLVAAGERIAHRDRAARQRSIERHDDAAALSHDGGRSARDGADAVVRNGQQAVRRRQVAVTIWTRHGDAGAFDGAAQRLGERAAFRIAAFAEAAREHRRAAGARFARRRDGLRGGRARYQHHHMIGLLRQIAQRRIAGLAVPHRRVARIDRIDLAGEAGPLQRPPHPARPAPGPVARSHDGDVGRAQQCPHARDPLLSRKIRHQARPHASSWPSQGRRIEDQPIA